MQELMREHKLMLKEDNPPRQVMDRRWMWEHVVQSMPKEAADAARLARNHKLHVNMCALVCWLVKHSMSPGISATDGYGL
ncbi:MAG: hypothetical protein HC767_13545 [Akkermansiaceae bacterium]|nr:hypothetical protein [Akkermansiaceae bacterium]